MASFTVGIASSSSIFQPKTIRTRPSTFKISCVQWDPEGIFKRPAQGGHIAKLEFKKKFEKDADAREAFERQMQEEKERRKALRESRAIPDTSPELVEYFLDTEAQEIEFEIARLRPRLTKEFFSEIKLQLGKIRFAVNKSQDMEDRLIELEMLEKALMEGIEAYDRMQGDLVQARESLAKILSSKDIKATLLDMVETNELNRALLGLLDENIASALESNQKPAAEFMEKLRGAVVKYITV